MKRGFLVLLLLWTVSPARSGVLLKPSLGFPTLSGKTDFDITFGGYDPTIDPTYGFIQGESKLEFDLKAVMADLGLEALTDDGAFGLSAHYAFSVAKGDGKFRDRDWMTNNYLNYTQGYPALGGDTLSDVKSPIHILTLGGKARLAHQRGYRLYGSLEFEHQQLGTFWVYNGTGYYTSWLTGGVYEPVNINSDTPVLSYMIRYDQYRLGLSGEFDLGRRYTLAGEAKAGLVSYRDFDNHILRGKTGDGLGKGFGVELGCTFGWKIRKNIDLALTGRYQHLSASGQQTQIDHTGPVDTLLGKIDQTVTTKELSIGLDVSYRFDAWGRRRVRNQL